MTRFTRRGSNSAGFNLFCRCCTVLLAGVFFIFLHLHLASRSSLPTAEVSNKERIEVKRSRPRIHPDVIRVAYIGNSLLFFNDCPGLIAAMAEPSGLKIEYDACLRGGASLTTIGAMGCSAGQSTSRDHLTLDKLLDRQWDYIILHDQSKAPSMRHVRKFNANYLNQTLAQPIYSTGATPVFLQTAGYRDTSKGFQGFEYMTKALREGYHNYADSLTDGMAVAKIGSTTGNRKAEVAPVGEAFAQVYNSNQELWTRLYMQDGIHPSALGAWLQCCVLFAAITGKEPPTYNPSFWKRKRGGMRTFETLPTTAEAKELREVAIKAMGL